MMCVIFYIDFYLTIFWKKCINNVNPLWLYYVGILYYTF